MYSLPFLAFQTAVPGMQMGSARKPSVISRNALPNFSSSASSLMYGPANTDRDVATFRSLQDSMSRQHTVSGHDSLLLLPQKPRKQEQLHDA